MREQPTYKHYTRGGQISFHNLRMWDQITKTLIILCLVVWAMLTGALTYFLIPFEKIEQALSYYGAYTLKLLGKKHDFQLLFEGHIHVQSVDALLHYPY